MILKSPPIETVTPELWAYAEKVATNVRIAGPASVLVNADGESVKWREAHGRGLRVNVFLIRQDGWTLGAAWDLAEAARLLWAEDWIAFFTSADKQLRRMTEWPKGGAFRG